MQRLLRPGVLHPMTHPTHGFDPNALEATRERAQAALDSARATGPNSTSQTALEYRLAECIDVIAALSQNPGTPNTSGEADDFLSTTRDTLGRKVREVWVAWARTQPQPKPSWLVPYDELSEPDKEADRRIGEAIW